MVCIFSGIIAGSVLAYINSKQEPTTQEPTTQIPTTQVPTTQVSTTQIPNINFAYDQNNCGSLGNICPVGQTCCNGRCRALEKGMCLYPKGQCSKYNKVPLSKSDADTKTISNGTTIFKNYLCDTVFPFYYRDDLTKQNTGRWTLTCLDGTQRMDGRGYGCNTYNTTSCEHGGQVCYNP